MKHISDKAIVFISSGAAYKNTQSLFLRSLEDLLELNNLSPRKVGRIEPGERPMSVVRQALVGSDGAVIVAFTRFEVKNGSEFPKSEKEKSIDGMRLPTMWNQLEGGIAYGLDIPILILLEKGLDRQGILGDGSEWLPLEIETSAAALKEQTFIDAFEDWRGAVQARARARRGTRGS